MGASVAGLAPARRTWPQRKPAGYPRRTMKPLFCQRASAAALAIFDCRSGVSVFALAGSPLTPPAPLQRRPHWQPWARIGTRAPRSVSRRDIVERFSSRSERGRSDCPTAIPTHHTFRPRYSQPSASKLTIAPPTRFHRFRRRQRRARLQIHPSPTWRNEVRGSTAASTRPQDSCGAWLGNEFSLRSPLQVARRCRHERRRPA